MKQTKDAMKGNYSSNFSLKETLKLEYNQNVKKVDKFGTLFEICKMYKYPLEKFVYETKDGYYNTVFHINGMKGTNAR